MTTNTFTIDIRALADIVKAAATCCGTDELLPVFRHIHFTVADGKLLARATDRYRAIVVRGEAIGAFTGMIHVVALKRVLQTFKTGRNQAAKVTFTLDTKCLTVGKTEGDLLDLNDAHLTFDAATGEFPTIDQLFTNGLNADQAAEPVTLNPDWLRQLPIIDRYSSVRMTNRGPGQPCLVITDRWLMAIMQMRAPADSVAKTRQDWVDSLPGPAAADEQAA